MRTFDGVDDKIDVDAGGAAWTKHSEIINGSLRYSHGHPLELDNGDIVVAFSTNEDGGPYIYKLVRSTDGGSTFGSKVTITPAPAASVYEGALVQWGAGAGTLLCVYAEGNEIRCRKSTDRGATWGAATTIATATGGYDTHHPSVVRLSDGTLIVVYNDAGDIVQQSSPDGGESWGGKATIASEGAGQDNLGDPCIIQCTNGDLLVAYQDRDTSYAIRTKRSADGGSTWGVAQTVVASAGYLNADPNLLRTTRALYLFFSDTRGVAAEADRWLKALVSFDDGRSWTYETYVNGDGDPHRANATLLSNGTPFLVCTAKDGDADYHINRLAPPAGWPFPNCRNLTRYTACAWIRYNGTPSASGNMYILSKDGTDRVHLYALDVSPNHVNELRVWAGRATASLDYESVQNVFADGALTFVAAVVDLNGPANQKVTFYVGTTPADLAAVSNALTTDGSGLFNDDTGGNLTIGSRTTDNNRVWKGELGNIQLINRTVSLAELRAVMAASRPTLGAESGYWPLWGAHSPEIDLAGGRNLGTVTGTTVAVLNPPTVPPSRRYWGNTFHSSVAAPVVARQFCLDVMADGWIARRVQAPLEVSGAIGRYFSMPFSYEELTPIARAFHLEVAAVRGLGRRYTLPVEADGDLILYRRFPMPVETVTARGRALALPVEASAGILSRTFRFPVEAGMGIGRAYRLPAEWSGDLTVLRKFGLPLETRQRLARQLGLPVEAAGQTDSLPDLWRVYRTLSELFGDEWRVIPVGVALEFLDTWNVQSAIGMELIDTWRILPPQLLTLWSGDIQLPSATMEKA